MDFKNEAQLRRFLLNVCKKTIVQTEQKVYKTIDSCLRQFYDEWHPEQYIRTSKLFHSLVRSNIRSVGNGFEAEVYFDASSLNYTTGTWDGETVLKVAMESSVPHGGYMEGTAIWTESNKRLGDILNLLETELRAQGIPIIK